MDNTENTPTVLSLCSGYGGIERGLKQAIGEVRVLAHVEIEAYAIANLISKMEQKQMASAPIWTNLKTLPTRSFREKVDILTGGYPCQPFSAAGKRLGTEDPRHLFPHILRIIDEVVPRMCFFENVEGHISLGLREVLQSLEERGYRTTWGIFSAEEVGAPHRRKRVFILADTDSSRFRQGNEEIKKKSSEQSDSNSIQSEDRELADTNLKRLEGCLSSIGIDKKRWEGQGGFINRCSRISATNRWFPNKPGKHQDPREELRTISKPSVGGATDGIANRVDRLRLLGNGVVPQTAELAFKTLVERLAL